MNQGVASLTVKILDGEWFGKNIGLSSSDIATNLNVHRSTGDRILQLFLDTGCVTKNSYPREAVFQKITPVCTMFIQGINLCH